MRLNFRFIALFVLFAASFRACAGTYEYGSLAVLLAKGYFKNDIDAAAPLEECVHFLNSHGVCFSLFDVQDPDAKVTVEDFARVVGQSTLLFLGEAEFEPGSQCIRKPLDAATWVDYCQLNDVSFKNKFEKFQSTVSGGYLPEVSVFFK